MSCSCTNEGYTGAPVPSNVSAIASGREPWKILKLATLPDAPVSRENVWCQGPNFGRAFYYDQDTDTLLFYGGFRDSGIGLMRCGIFCIVQEGLARRCRFGKDGNKKQPAAFPAGGSQVGTAVPAVRNCAGGMTSQPRPIKSIGRLGQPSLPDLASMSS